MAGSEESAALAVTWSCGDFPEKATQGTYTFTAALPQGYTLGAEAASLAVSVILGGGETLPAATKPAGEGTEASPYQISTAAELYWFAQVVNGTVKDGTAQNAAACATLTGDIDLTNISWVSIGSQSAPYTGTFDGNGHTLTHLTIRSDSDYQGFVGYLGAGTIKDLTLDESSSVTGGKNTGAICGWNNAGTITGCTNNGTVNGKGDLGGICGHNLGTVENCTNTGTVTSSNERVGGICGFGDVTITGCWNTGDITGGTNVGGICGENHSKAGTIQSCYSTGTVTGSKAGGFCGCNNCGTITNCYWLDTAYETGIGDGDGEATSKTEKGFASGEVTYLLNGQQSDPETNAWFQNLDNFMKVDAFPVLDTAHGTVYQVAGDPVWYSNYPGGEIPQVTSVEITWGNLSYTYDEGTWNASTHTYEGGGWTAADNGNSVTVQNTGTLDVTASYTYNPVVTGITGSFTDGEGNPVTAPATLKPTDISAVILP